MNAREKAVDLAKLILMEYGSLRDVEMNQEIFRFCGGIIEQALLQARDEALELAAQECFKWIDAECCADAIRALKSKKE